MGNGDRYVVATWIMFGLAILATRIAALIARKSLAGLKTSLLVGAVLLTAGVGLALAGAVRSSRGR